MKFSGLIVLALLLSAQPRLFAQEVVPPDPGTSSDSSSGSPMPSSDEGPVGGGQTEGSEPLEPSSGEPIGDSCPKVISNNNYSGPVYLHVFRKVHDFQWGHLGACDASMGRPGLPVMEVKVKPSKSNGGWSEDVYAQFRKVACEMMEDAQNQSEDLAVYSPPTLGTSITAWRLGQGNIDTGETAFGGKEAGATVQGIGAVTAFRVSFEGPSPECVASVKTADGNFNAYVATFGDYCNLPLQTLHDRCAMLLEAHRTGAKLKIGGTVFRKAENDNNTDVAVKALSWAPTTAPKEIGISRPAYIR